MTDIRCTNTMKDADTATWPIPSWGIVRDQGIALEISMGSNFTQRAKLQLSVMRLCKPGNSTPRLIAWAHDALPINRTSSPITTSFINLMSFSITSISPPRSISFLSRVAQNLYSHVRWFQFPSPMPSLSVGIKVPTHSTLQGLRR